MALQMERDLEIIGILLEKRIPRKEINLNVWATTAAVKLGLEHPKAYARVKAAARQMAAEGVGVYKEGRRGRESRFLSKRDVKEYAEEILGKIQQKESATKVIIREKAPFTEDELAALKGLLNQKVEATKTSLEDFSEDELWAALVAKRQQKTHP